MYITLALMLYQTYYTNSSRPVYKSHIITPHRSSSYMWPIATDGVGLGLES